MENQTEGGPSESKGTLAKIGHGFKMFFTGLLFIFVCFIMFTIVKQMLADDGGSTPKPKPIQAEAEVETEKYSDVELYVVSQAAIEKFLQFPETAEYQYPVESHASIQRHTDGQIVITSKVTAKNAYGVPSTHTYVVWFKETSDDMIITDVYLDGKEMYRKDAE